MLADLRPLGLSHDHAHEIVRLGVGRREPHRVARVDLGLGQGASLEQAERQGLGRGEVVGLQPHDSRQRGIGGHEPFLCAEQFVKGLKQHKIQRRRGQGPHQNPLRLCDVARRIGRLGLLDLGPRVRDRPRGRPVQRATAADGQPAAAGARGWGLDVGVGDIHEPPQYRFHVRPQTFPAARKFVAWLFRLAVAKPPAIRVSGVLTGAEGSRM